MSGMQCSASRKPRQVANQKPVPIAAASCRQKLLHPSSHTLGPSSFTLVFHANRHPTDDSQALASSPPPRAQAGKQFGRIHLTLAPYQ